MPRFYYALDFSILEIITYIISDVIESYLQSIYSFLYRFLSRHIFFIRVKSYFSLVFTRPFRDKLNFNKWRFIAFSHSNARLTSYCSEEALLFPRYLCELTRAVLVLA